jgi:hypothetical protein
MPLAFQHFQQAAEWENILVIMVLLEAGGALQHMSILMNGHGYMLACAVLTTQRQN